MSAVKSNSQPLQGPPSFGLATALTSIPGGGEHEKRLHLNPSISDLFHSRVSSTPNYLRSGEFSHTLVATL
jgi:hypothetical protein